MKYAGSKLKLMPEVLPYYHASGFKDIVEPFAGSAALFFNLAETGIKAHLNDDSQPLINFYQQLNKDNGALIAQSKKFQPLHSKPFFEHVKHYDRFNLYDDAVLAARYLYINKCGYNGMYRVDTKLGYCNISFGTQKKYHVNEDNLRWSAEKLNQATLTHGEFDKTPMLKRFHLIDPPYVDTFTGYTKGKVDDNFHTRLRDYVDKLDAAGIPFLLTNRHCDFMIELFNGYHQRKIETNYDVSCKTSGRGKKYEIFISNIDATA
nr:Dam family site-specific DNA-(adenine-N6)-methyltransferase [Pseudoalteromonas sp. C2R02]